MLLDEGHQLGELREDVLPERHVSAGEHGEEDGQDLAERVGLVLDSTGERARERERKKWGSGMRGEGARKWGMQGRVEGRGGGRQAPSMIPLTATEGLPTEGKRGRMAHLWQVRHARQVQRPVR